MTLADIEVTSCPTNKIKELEDELVKSLKKIKIRSILIDPKAELKEQKEAGNVETLIEYERIGVLAS